MYIVIDGTKHEVKEVYQGSYLPEVCTDGGDFYVAQNSKVAGKKAREIWQDMAQNDKKEFAAMVGEKCLIAWALGEYAGPGSTQVDSLKDWLDLWLDTPEEEFASYDGEEREVNSCSKDLRSELGFRPTVAYRHN